jgi:Beta-ketoacyl synthase, N-terminal domain
MDPQCRIMLEETLASLAKVYPSSEGAATGTPAATARADTGVYVGSMYQEYLELAVASGQGATPALITGNSMSFLVGRVSYAFDLQVRGHEQQINRWLLCQRLLSLRENGCGQSMMRVSLSVRLHLTKQNENTQCTKQLSQLCKRHTIDASTKRVAQLCQGSSKGHKTPRLARCCHAGP